MSTDLSPQAVENRLERVVEGYSSPRLFKLHRQRYQFALRFVESSDRVVDCACGSGYGSRILAPKARCVLAFDISPVAIAYCQKHYPQSNIGFQVAAAENLPIAAKSIEVFCCFETLEHLQDARRFLKEVERTLKPGGRFIFSTPNRVAARHKRERRPANPHHRAEWSFGELHELIRERFYHCQYFAQKIRSDSKLSPMYWRSKWKRLLGRLDFTPIPLNERMLAALEEPGHWQPRYFLGNAR